MDEVRTINGEPPQRGSAGEIFLAFLKLGCTSFGGPVAHLGYFRNELVERRRWLTDAAYAELVALCQFLPGPASSQVGFGIGLTRGGLLGGLAAWTGFTLPSALIMFGFALIAADLTGPIAEAVIAGLKIAAVAVVAHALVGMARKLTPDFRRAAIAMITAAAMLFVATPAAQIGFILLGALVGMLVCDPKNAAQHKMAGWAPGKRFGIVCLALFTALLIGLSLVGWAVSGLAIADIFYRAGALVFGGGHVVLPLLDADLVPGWMSDSDFLAGYGAAQAIPGPLFTLSAYLGAVALPGAAWAGALIALVAIFLPGMLLLMGTLPFRTAIGNSGKARAAVAGVNAVVVGLLAAALYDPLWTSAIFSLADAMIALAGFALLTLWRTPPLLVVAGSATASVGLALL